MTSYILSLPYELLSEILGHSDLKSLVAARLTCRTLFSVTKARVIWLMIIQKLQCAPYMSSMEEPIEEYTNEELESWAVARLRADDAWRSQPAAPLRLIHIPFPFEDRPTASIIVPGGRWLLVLFHGRICYCDLDSSDYQTRVLLDIPGEDYQHVTQFNSCTPGWAIWLDESKPKLTFRLVVSGCYRNDCDHYLRAWVHEVKLVGHGSTATLAAGSPLTILNVPDVGCPPNFALDGENCVCTHEIIISLHGRRRTWLSIFPYGFLSAKSATSIYPLTVVISNTFGVSGVNLLPFRRLLLISRQALEIYDYSRNISTLYPTYQLLVPLGHRPATLFNPIRVHDTTRIIFQTSANVFSGLSISDDPTNQVIPSTNTLQSLNHNILWIPGYKRTVMVQYGGIIQLFEHDDWDDPSMVFQIKSFDLGLPSNIPTELVTMSEERGRLVSLQKTGVTVLDLLCLENRLE